MIAHLRRRGAAIGAVIITCAGFSAVAGAAPVGFSTSPIAGWSTDAPVRTVLIAGNTVFAGGDFTQVRAPGGTTTATRAHLAAWDIHTGLLRTTFAADTNGRVESLATDGTKLFVGGDFTTIQGVAKSRLAAIDLTSGAVVNSWTANASSHVYALRVKDSRLYVGGSFGTLAGATRNKMGAVSVATGALDPLFNPNINDAVHGIVTSPDGTTVYVGGDFTTVGGIARGYLAPVSSTTGALLPLTFQYPFSGTSLHGMDGLDISPSGDRLFGALTGNENRVEAWSTTTGQVQWYYQVDGDTQAVRYYRGNVYFGFHEGAIGDHTVRMLVADAATGQLENSYRPPIDSFFGIWAIDASADALVLGGEFTNINGVATQGVAILPPAASDPIAPTAPGTPVVTDTHATSASIAWTPGTDNVGVAGYRVLRNGVETGFPTAPAFTDTNLPPDSDVTYTVQTVDAAGNVSPPSGPVVVHTGLLPLAAGAAWKYLDNGTDQGTTWRAPAFNDATWASGAAELGYGDGDETTVVGYGPDPNNKYITTYFRRTFTVRNLAELATLTVKLVRDDGAVVYVNGTEVVRSTLPMGTITSATRATAAIADAAESQWNSFAVNPSVLVAGTNTIAVEIHQNGATSRDISFNLALEATRAAAAPTNPPPTGLAVTGVTDTTVTVQWNAPVGSGITTGYRVYRGGVLVGSPTTTNFTDSPLASGQTYGYTVSAITDGVETATTATVNATTIDNVAPNAPTNLTAPTIAADHVTLAWTPATDNVGVTAYDVMRNGVIVGTSTAATATDSTVAVNQTYSYTVQARDAAGNVSPPSVALSVTTPAFVAKTYEDTFDSGTFAAGKWNTLNAATVAGTTPGTFFARLSAGAGAAAYLNWPTTAIEQGHRSWSFRGYFKIESHTAGQSVSLIELKNVAGKSLYLYTNATTGRCTASIAGQSVTTSFACDDHAWHLIEMKGDLASSYAID